MIGARDTLCTMQYNSFTTVSKAARTRGSAQQTGHPTKLTMATAATTATIGGSTTRDTTRVTRLHEKIELGHIGERLTAYIDRVKELGDKRPQLETLLQTTRLLEEEISSLKETYEVEIAEARRLVDETANENARLQLETSRSQKLSRELQQRLSDEISLRRRAEGNRTLVERALEHKEHQLQEAIRDQEPPKR